MPEEEEKLIIVDTNCFVRLFLSDLQPILMRPLPGYRLRTLEVLVKETRPRTRLGDKHAWLNQKEIQDELKQATLELSQEDRDEYQAWEAHYAASAKVLIDTYCREKGLEPRSLSKPDVQALFYAGYLPDALLATDEWPLRMAAERLIEPAIEVWSTLDLVKLLENAGLFTADARRTLVKRWLQEDEWLPWGWRAQHEQLFGENPPTVQ